MNLSLKSPRVLLALLAMACPVLAEAGISLMGSRVIYEESQGEAVAQLRQSGDNAGLVQIWLDRGDDSPDAHVQETSFLITPSVARMDPYSGQTIRIIRVGDDLPQDRESMLFFNVLEVPPAATEHLAAGDNFIQFSSRMRLKFFYRPKGLALKPAQAYQLLQFSLLPDRGEQDEIQVRIYNPTPYHVTFKELTLRNGKGSDALAELSETVGVHQTTVPPMEELILPLVATSGEVPMNISGLQVAFGVIGDLGNTISGQRELD